MHDATAGRFAKATERSRINAQQARFAGYRVIRIPPLVDILDGSRPRRCARSGHGHFVQQRESVSVGVQHFCACIVAHSPNYQ
jgi:hypothetical protein